MPNLKAIRRRIQSVRNTRQITRAMKLVSTAKLKRAEEAALNGRLFSERLQAAILAVMAALPRGYQHPFIGTPKPGGMRRVVVITGERGLCGAYNTNVVKAAHAGELDAAVPVEFVTIGRRASSAAKRYGWKLANTIENLPDDINRWPIGEAVTQLLKNYTAGKFSEIVIYYTRFKSVMAQEVTRDLLFPIDPAILAAGTNNGAIQAGQFRYHPDPEKIFDLMLPLYVRAKIYEAVLNSKASEHAARMQAMDAATRNADELIQKLTLFYNRARQSAITRDLIDIVGGAEALE